MINEQPPADVPDNLREYLSRMFNSIHIDGSKTFNLPPRYTLPEKPKEGNIYYFAQTIAPDITAIGFWGYTSSGWVQL